MNCDDCNAECYKWGQLKWKVDDVSYKQQFRPLDLRLACNNCLTSSVLRSTKHVTYCQAAGDENLGMMMQSRLKSTVLICQPSVFHLCCSLVVVIASGKPVKVRHSWGAIFPRQSLSLTSPLFTMSQSIILQHKPKLICGLICESEALSTNANRRGKIG